MAKALPEVLFKSAISPVLLYRCTSAPFSGALHLLPFLVGKQFLGYLELKNHLRRYFEGVGDRLSIA